VNPQSVAIPISDSTAKQLSITIQVPIGAATETITDAYHIYLPIVYGSGQWTDCSQSSFGTMLIHGEVPGHLQNWSEMNGLEDFQVGRGRL
jgi:hypothetical protein